MTSRRWLVTGVAGFIGSNLAEDLMRRGERVRGLDNFFSGRRANVERLTLLFGSQFEFVEASILDEGQLLRAMEGCQVVAHLAAQVSVIRSIDDPEETHAINTTGFMRVMRCASKLGVEHLVYASTCAVYGDSTMLPLAETTPPRPMSPYAASKLANEAYARGFKLAPQMRVIGLRFFNIFGPWQDASGGYAAVIPRWIELARSGRQVVIFGDGSATRDFCHVSNVCRAIWEASHAGAELSGDVFNVATGLPTRLDDLHAMICDAISQTGVICSREFRHEPWREGEILHSYADTTRASQCLGFQAEVDLATGLRHMLAIEGGLSRLN